jgi:hypothetical protein
MTDILLSNLFNRQFCYYYAILASHTCTDCSLFGILQKTSVSFSTCKLKSQSNICKGWYASNTAIAFILNTDILGFE